MAVVGRQHVGTAEAHSTRTRSAARDVNIFRQRLAGFFAALLASQELLKLAGFASRSQRQSSVSPDLRLRRSPEHYNTLASRSWWMVKGILCGPRQGKASFIGLVCSMVAHQFIVRDDQF